MDEGGNEERTSNQVQVSEWLSWKENPEEKIENMGVKGMAGQTVGEGMGEEPNQRASAGERCPKPTR